MGCPSSSVLTPRTIYTSSWMVVSPLLSSIRTHPNICSGFSPVANRMIPDDVSCIWLVTLPIVLATLQLWSRLCVEKPLQGTCGISSRSVLLCYTVQICDSQRDSFSCLLGDFHHNTHTQFYRPACRICTVSRPVYSDYPD